MISITSFLILLLWNGMAVNGDDNDPSLFEGDIVLDPDTMNIMSGSYGYDVVKNKEWTNGIIPYAFDYNFGRDTKRVNLVKMAIAEYHKYTCLRFVPRTWQKRYVKFIIGRGCYSQIGMNREEKPQEVSIGHNCDKKGTIIHELMHAIGFFHEQSRLDRDTYITINWSKIQPQSTFNFNKYTRGQADYLNEPYDYNSIMHYGPFAFSTDGTDTIIPKDKNAFIGQRKGFSQIDINQINKLYGCPARVLPATPKPACVNLKPECDSWAKAGYCTMRKFYGTYITDNCVKACNLC